ncbi:PREDICTED: pyroglutamyl-peptidase 1 [Ceratosolen solmsi marchali]|uniref:Pyroglutamyl-peptidase 1 n=1 Tax=Ceratosolen solmsi marchali TaxID=326594 RepID=A0AAJ6YHN4_9HYME|nr:PREDICTED: pyroglutamyl-peptidase 1 [Ceratosolen solmsi marchali]
MTRLSFYVVVQESKNSFKMENEVRLTVLVTGFGPFGSHKINASWEAVKQLPELFKTLGDSMKINLIVEEIPVAYKQVSFKVKELWEKYKPSIIMHVGVSRLATCLVIERQANNNGYIKSDIFNNCPEEEDIDSQILKTTCDVKKICEAVNRKSDEINCKASISDDAGRYLCEYIYYQSLSIGEPQVLFVHVPDLHIYPSSKTAQGILEILLFLSKTAIELK